MTIYSCVFSRGYHDNLLCCLVKAWSMYLRTAVNENTILNVAKLYEILESRICFLMCKYMTGCILKVPSKCSDCRFGSKKHWKCCVFILLVRGRTQSGH